MSIARSVAEVLDEHVTLELECIDRMYCNLYIPILQSPEGVAWFFKHHRGHAFASSALMAPITKAFIEHIESFAEREGIDLVTFRRGERKEDIAKEYLDRFSADEGVLFIGKAQEKTAVVRTERRRNPQTGAPYAWLVKTTAVINQYYFYCVDRDFGPFFIKFASYFPCNGKLCFNGHEYLKRQLAKRHIPFTALDNGIAECADPKKMQTIADELDAEKIDALARKWFRRLPHPLPARDRAAGFRYEISTLQAEFSLTQVFDRPLSGRFFFEQVIRDNLDAGRPDQVQLIFDRRVMRTTPGRFRTRVLSDGVIPSHSGPRPPSTTPATSPSAESSRIFPPCGKSASPPIDASSASNESAMTARSAKTRSNRSITTFSATGNTPLHSHSVTLASWHFLAPWSSSVFFPEASPTPTCASMSLPCSAYPQTS